jgi:hypothetical protein
MDMTALGDTAMAEFNLVLCLGNTLALSKSISTFQKLLEDVFSKLSKDGILVAQVLNFEEILHTGFRFFPVKYSQTPSGKKTAFFRFFDHCVDQETSDLIITSFVQEGLCWRMLSSVQSVLRLTEELVKVALAEAGFNKAELFAGYDGAPFNAKNDRNLVIKAHR